MKHNWKVSLIFAALLMTFVAYPAYSVKYDKSNPTKMYSKAYKMIDKGQFSKAQKILKNYTKSEPNDSDGWTLLAFTYRKLEKYKASEESHVKALNIDPENKSALEYQGELFVETNRLDQANINVGKLQKLCPKSCSELEKLESYITNSSSKSNI